MSVGMELPVDIADARIDIESSLGALAKLQKANVSFVMSVRSPALKNSVSTWRIFKKFQIWVFFENQSSKFKFL